MRTLATAVVTLPLLLAALATPGRAQPGKLPPVEVRTPPPYPVLPAAEAEPVRAVLRAYVDAVQRRDGAAAVQLVTRSTRGYYARMRDLAMTAPEAAVRAAPAMDRMSILMFRHRVPAEVLRTLTGDSAFAYTISDGWVSATTARQPAATAEVFGSGDRAVLRDGGGDVEFAREDGAWRWDMMPVIRMANADFATIVPRGMTEDELIVRVLEMSSGRPVSPGVWQPVQ